MIAHGKIELLRERRSHLGVRIEREIRERAGERITDLVRVNAAMLLKVGPHYLGAQLRTEGV